MLRIVTKIPKRPFSVVKKIKITQEKEEQQLVKEYNNEFETVEEHEHFVSCLFAIRA
jgi:hypothetical protein